MDTKQMHERIAELRRKILLTKSKQEIQFMQDEIDELNAKIKASKHKKPVIVPVKDAPTIGDRMEAQLAGKGRKSRYNGNSVAL